MTKSIKALQDSARTWNYATMLFVEASKQLQKSVQHRVANELLYHCTLAASVEPESPQCYTCHKFGHTVLN